MNPRSAAAEPSAELSAAIEHGRICALAAECQRDLQDDAAAFPGLFPPSPFDARLFSTVALANAFGSPWETRERLRTAARTSLWVFAADWAVDHKATTRDEVEAITRTCLAAADGASPQNELAGYLAAIRTDLTESSAFSAAHAIWRDRLDRYLTAMAREWEWKTGLAPAPDFAAYLANADNFGSNWVNVSHWIATSGEPALGRLPDLLTAGEAVQRVLRLLNDQASYQREVDWVDLNSLMLTDADHITDRTARETADARELIAGLRADCPVEAAYLERQIGYSTGFYRQTDYWGTT